MRARTVLIVAGFTGGLGWLAKMVILTAQQGPDPESLLESIAFVVGLLGVVVASVAAGAFLARARPTGWRVLAGVAAVLIVGTVISSGQAVLTAVPGDSWVREEAIFGVIGLLAVVVAAAALLRGAAADAEGSGPGSLGPVRRPPS